MDEEPGHRLGELIERSDPDLRTVMSCVFGIKAHETRTYLVLLGQPGSTVEELSAALERDRSTVNRLLSTLTNRGLVWHERRLLDGGYVYQYTAIALPEAKAMLHDAFETWTDSVHGVIDGFDGGRP